MQELGKGLIVGLENGVYSADYLRKVDVLVAVRFGYRRVEQASKKHRRRRGLKVEKKKATTFVIAFSFLW
ncbi:hypothetical protein DXN04_09405 [Chitinophaga silvisoli]|uniref:Uncharacterized protein n=1 Tax=Chitinophaga silvisoli TaxID=2291814 RepID=A0A3E1P5W6_9BACT|nr:hypothetical protein DXN04_09405 [Chitinophaga silvisoli]